MHTSQDPQDYQREKMLKEKLKTHIQREFNLGEKVISLLKQKKQLEESLQDQRNAQTALEKELEKINKGKKSIEQKFLQAQQELQEKQQKLKTRSRIIIEDEENSRETLEQLRQKIGVLQGQLDVVDAKKVEEKKRLIRNIQKLRQKEKLQSQKLQKISHQRDTVESRLHSAVKKYKHLATVYHRDKKQHEQQLETLYQEQFNREARIELLRDEKHINEENLLKEIESLKQAKTELEGKLEHLQQQASPDSWAVDSDLLQVIEKQNQYIQELKEKARKRSAILKEENETLRKEMETIADTQEKVKWENQMLESSLKDLQADLAEYLQLRDKFEAVQQEKENFEKLFQRRLQFLEHYEEEGQTSQSSQSDSTERIVEEQTDRDESFQNGEDLGDQKSFLKKIFPKKHRLMGWLSMSKPKLLTAFLVLLMVALSIQIYRLIPWRYLRPVRVSETEKVFLKSSALHEMDLQGEQEGFLSEKPDVKGPQNQEQHVSKKKLPEKSPATAEAPVTNSSSRKRQSKKPAPKIVKTPVQRSQAPEVKRDTRPKPSVRIVVQLSALQANRFPLSRVLY